MPELVTGDALARWVKSKHAEPAADPIIAALTPLKRSVRTMTFDGGLKSAQHRRIGKACAPKLTWQIHLRAIKERAMRITTFYCDGGSPRGSGLARFIRSNYQKFRHGLRSGNENDLTGKHRPRHWRHHQLIRVLLLQLESAQMI